MTISISIGCYNHVWIKWNVKIKMKMRFTLLSNMFYLIMSIVKVLKYILIKCKEFFFYYFYIIGSVMKIRSWLGHMGLSFVCLDYHIHFEI
jgi:hypothetical protein